MKDDTSTPISDSGASPNEFESDKPGTSARTLSEGGIEKLRAAGGVFVDAVRATRMPMVLTDPKLPGNPIVFANAAFLKLSGYSMDEVLGQQPHFMNGPDTDPLDAARFREMIRADQDEVLETVQYRKNGQRFVATVLISAFKDDTGRTLHHFMSWLDVTRRVDAEDEVSELREVRAALEVSEAKYRGLFDTIDEGFCVIQVLFDDAGRSTDYRVLEVNRAFECQTGLTDVSGKLMRTIAPDHEEHWFERYGRIARTGVPERFEAGANALGRWYDVYAFRIGRPEEHRVAVLFRDILDRKRAEHALRASEERLRNVLEGMDECFGIMNHELRIITQNKAALAIDGRPLSEIEGRTHSEVYPNADPAIEALYHRALTGGRPVSLEHRYGWQDGRASWLEMRAFPVPEGLAVFWRDISKRKLSETRLKECEERFRLVADNISQLAWTCDSLGNVNWYNQRWLDYTGMSFDDMKSWGWEKVQHPEHAERVVAGVKRAAASGEPWEDTFPLRRYDGEYRWFYSRAMPIRDERGDIVQWFGTNTDVTDRFEAEEKLRDSERHQRTLLAELQHRVRNTLAVVRSIARRTAERSDSTEDMISHFEGRLSAFSRIQSVVTRSPERGVDLKSLIEDELLAVTARDGHTLRAKGPEIVLRSRAAESVSLAIHELATNAVKYGALTIASGRIQVRWDRVDDDDGARLDLEWLESGLGYAPKPTREGFGHELLKRSLPYELQARTNIEFTDDGLRFTLTMPLSSDMVVGAERND